MGGCGCRLVGWLNGWLELRSWEGALLLVETVTALSIKVSVLNEKDVKSSESLEVRLEFVFDAR